MKKFLFGICIGALISGSTIFLAYTVYAKDYIETQMRMVTDSPNVLAFATNEELNKYEDNFVRAQAQSYFYDQLIAPDDNNASQYRLSTKRNEFGATEWALYYSECNNDAAGCCVKKTSGSTLCGEKDELTLDQRIQNMEAECQKKPTSQDCNKILLQSMKQVRDMDPDKRKTLYYARAYEAWKNPRPERGVCGDDRESVGFDEVKDHLDKLKYNTDINAEESSAARFQYEMRTRLLTGIYPCDEQVSLEPHVPDEIANIPGFSDLSYDQKCAVALYQMSQQVAEQMKSHYDQQTTFLSGLAATNEKARQERMEKKKAELATVAQNISQNSNCTNPSDCYMVYDAGHEEGVSVTGGQTLSSKIDIR
ncbi:MAG: hypothetical protein J6Y85_04395 [Alphaproteobacteria bacterium]|nr:hypothetical protein [Alphaproteobacteria bacterium]